MKKLLALALLLLSACKNLETTIENIAPPNKSSKGDGYIFFDYITYEKRYNIADEESVRIVLKVKKEDVQRAQIIMDGKAYDMMSIGDMGEFEYFEGKVTKIKDGKFHFKIGDGDLNYYFGEKGAFNEKEIVPLEYSAEESAHTNGNDKLWYRVYVDGFYNGNINNDPLFNEYGPESFMKPDSDRADIADNWGTNIPKKILGKFQLNSWTADFNERLYWENKVKSVYGIEDSTKRFGGDLQGLEAKIPYFKNYSADVLWISSPFYSFSGNKNDVIDFRHISPDYGVTETKDGESEYKKLAMKTGNSNNLNESLETETWVNSESDSCFGELINKLQAQDIKIVADINLDYVSNRFFAFEDVLKNGKDSVYWDWFYMDGEFKDKVYEGSSDNGIESKYGIRYRKSFVKILPEYTEAEKQELLNWNRENMGYKALGAQRNLIKLNLENKEVQNYLVNAADKWLNMGLAGYVIRVREAGNEAFYKEFESRINGENRYIIRYDLIDSKNSHLDKDRVLSYELVDSFQKFFGNGSAAYGGQALYTSLYIQNRNRKAVNFIEGTDIDRLNSSFINGNREFDTNNEEAGVYLGIRPDILDASTLPKYKLAIFAQFLLSGNQSIYYGSEKFMWGGDVPHNRKAMLWEDYFPYDDATDSMSKYNSIKSTLDTKVIYDGVEDKIRYKVVSEKSMEEFYKNLIKIKKDYKDLLNYGLMERLSASDNILVFSKNYKGETLVFAINKGAKEEKVILEIGKGKELEDLLNGAKKDILNKKAEISIPAYGYLIYKKINK